MPAPEQAEFVRLFLALDLPDPARGELTRWRDATLATRDELRPVADAALHVTLVFLGRREQALVQSIWGSAAAAAAALAAPSFVVRGAKWIPPRRARLLAVDLEDREGRGAALHAAVSSALVDAGLHESEGRPFWPHITVARVRGRSKVRDTRPIPMGGTPFDAPVLTLYRSDLHPAGARYVPLERLELGG